MSIFLNKKIIILGAATALALVGCKTDGSGGTPPAPTSYSLTATAPTGGVISSADGGINCGSDCSQSYSSGTAVTLNAVANSGYTFTGWAGDCSGTAACNLTLSANRSAAATFQQNGTTPPPSPPPSGGTDLGAGLYSDKTVRVQGSLTKPAVGQCVTDPAFGTKICRVSASSNSQHIRPVYSTVQAWNADESLMILYKTGAGEHQLYNGKTYQFIRVLNIRPAALEQVYWSTKEANILFYIDNYNAGHKSLMRYDVSTDTATNLHNFDWCTNDDVSAGSDPMYSSWDSDTFGLQCGATKFSYKISTNTESRKVTISGDAQWSAAAPAPDGNLFYHAGKVLDGNMSTVRTLNLNDLFEHASVGSWNGKGAYFTVIFGATICGEGTLIAYDLTTGACQQFIGTDTGYPYPWSDTHISAVAYKAPGWVVTSGVGEGDANELLEGELSLVNTTDSKVYRVAHHRSKGDYGSVGYWAEPHPSPSPSGSRIVFASDWGGSQVDAYVVELPSYVK